MSGGYQSAKRNWSKPRNLPPAQEWHESYFLFQEKDQKYYVAPLVPYEDQICTTGSVSIDTENNIQINMNDDIEVVIDIQVYTTIYILHTIISMGIDIIVDS